MDSSHKPEYFSELFRVPIQIIWGSEILQIMPCFGVGFFEITDKISQRPQIALLEFFKEPLNPGYVNRGVLAKDSGTIVS